MLSDKKIVELRGQRQQVDPWTPFGISHDLEYGADHRPNQTSTMFLTGHQCRFHCLMCDLWKYTTAQPTPAGAIPQQIRSLLPQIPHRQTLKLYNASNFFDATAIPTPDLPIIADLVADFQRIIVENHPRLTRPALLDFSRTVSPRLEVAMGLETANPDILQQLNKKMSRDDFAQAVDQLRSWQIDSRCFVIYQLPGVPTARAHEDLYQSVEFAFQSGVDVCVAIPLRSGNGAVDLLLSQGQCQLPDAVSFCNSVIQCLPLTRVYQSVLLADLWDLKSLPHCQHCLPYCHQVLQSINQTQTLDGDWPFSAIACPSCAS